MNQREQLTVQLDRLREIIEDSKAILEWRKLKVFEANLNRTSKVFFQDDTFQQLMDKQVAFQATWIEANMLLQDKTIKLSQDEINKFKKELNKLSLQFYYLGTDVRIL